MARQNKTKFTVFGGSIKYFRVGDRVRHRGRNTPRRFTWLVKDKTVKGTLLLTRENKQGKTVVRWLRRRYQKNWRKVK